MNLSICPNNNDELKLWREAGVGGGVGGLQAGEEVKFFLKWAGEGFPAAPQAEEIASAKALGTECVRRRFKDSSGVL